MPAEPAVHEIDSTDESDAPTGDDAQPRTVRSVQRAIDILSLFTGANSTHSIGEIVSATGLAKTTVIRLLETLEVNGLLASTHRGYVPGPGLWRWAFAIHQAWELPPSAQKVMTGLVEAERETVNLYIRRGDVRICVAQRESPLPLRHVVRIGDHLPLWAGATSKVLLSDADPADVERLYAVGASRGTDDGPTLDDFRREIAAVGDLGYAVSHGEREAGLSAVAVPVRSADGGVIASLSFSGPTARFPAERVPGLAEQLTAAARQLTVLGVDHPLRSA